MSSLKKSLEVFLSGATAIAVLGVGSEMRADDAAGMLLAELLDIYTDKKDLKFRFKVFMGSTAPENYTGEIKKFKPSHVLILDCAEMRSKPGEYMLLNIDQLNDFSFTTHKMPISVLVNYLEAETGCKTAILGIQPKTIEFGLPPTQEIKNAVHSLFDIIREMLEGKYQS